VSHGVSVVVPVYDGRRHLRAVVEAALAQQVDRELEILLVDDGSADGSRALAQVLAREHPAVRALDGPRRGAPAAINAGVAAGSHPLILQLDQDVVALPGYLEALLVALEADADLAGVQGHYVTTPEDGLWVRVAGLDLAQRYASIPGDLTDHVCTGNTLYRRQALEAVGGFDESIGYGYDNDMSYRLGKAGWRLAIARSARSLHRMPPGPRSYLRRQYGYGYGRLDLIARHPDRVAGDQVSGLNMIGHAGGTLVALLLLAGGAALCGVGLSGLPLLLAGAAILSLLWGERALAGLRAAWRHRDPAGLFFAVAHPARDLAWATAIARWSLRRLLRRGGRPEHSMIRPAAAQPSP
jgi:GT2 family glycosyltransferase